MSEWKHINYKLKVCNQPSLTHTHLPAEEILIVSHRSQGNTVSSIQMVWQSIWLYMDTSAYVDYTQITVRVTSYMKLLGRKQEMLFCYSGVDLTVQHIIISVCVCVWSGLNLCWLSLFFCFRLFWQQHLMLQDKDFISALLLFFFSPPCCCQWSTLKLHQLPRSRQMEDCEDVAAHTESVN